MTRATRPPFAIALAAALSLANASCIYARIFYFNTPNLHAPDNFDERVVHATSPRPLPRSPHEARFALTDEERQEHLTFDDLLEDNDTRAFVVVKDDRVIYERYFDGTTETTRLPGFSTSKTVSALLVGCAADDGLLDVRDRLVRHVPELADHEGYSAISIDHLLRMVSGIDFDEESHAGAVLYYSTDIRSHLYSYDMRWAPGTRYAYGSINIELLWDVLRRKLGSRTVSDYFAARVWGPLGAEHDASWSLDSEEGQTEKMFGGFNATARDHARIGLLYLHHGSIDGHAIVSRSWVARSLEPDPVPGVVKTSDGYMERGRYQWFLTRDHRAYFAKGYHGQYVFVVPDRNMVFVRFGEGYGDIDWPTFFLRLADESDAARPPANVELAHARQARAR